MSREYKSGTTWCVWRWTFTPSNYITRLHLVKTPWFALMVHWLNGPDPEPDMHDHPVTLLSFIVSGGYSEARPGEEWEPGVSGGDLYARRWFNLIRATTIHRIVGVLPRTITFCIAGPKVREWGFHTANGWVPWQEYNQKYRSEA